MKVIYENNVVDNIYAAIRAAAKENKKIKEIELSRAEWREFHRGTFSMFNVIFTTTGTKTGTELSRKFEGVTIKTSYWGLAPLGMYGDV